MKVRVIPIAAAEPTCAALERPREDLERRHRGRVARPAVRGDVDEIEVAQRVDRRQRQRHRDLAAQPRQRHRQELPERPRAVDARRVIQRRRDLLHARGQQHHRQPEVDVGTDQPHRRQCQREVPQPRLALDPEPPEEPVQEPVVGVVDHLPGERDDDHRDHLRQEQDRAEERQPAHARARHHTGQQQPDQQRQHRVEEQQDQRVNERRTELLVGEDLLVVRDAGPRRDRQPVPLPQRDPRRVRQRQQHEAEEHREGGQQVQVPDKARLAGRALGHCRAPAGRRAPRRLGDGSGRRAHAMSLGTPTTCRRPSGRRR